MSARVGHGASIDDRVVSVASVDDFGPIAPEWDALAEGSASIFQTALWARRWWAHFGEGHDLLLRTARTSDGSLVAVLPLYAWRRRFPRVVRFLGHGPGDELGPVYSRDLRGEAASALRSALDGLDWDVFFGEQLPGDEGWPSLLGGSTWRREASPSLTLPTTWEEYLGTRSSNFREQLRRREAGLAKAGEVVVRRSEAATLERDLDALFELHRARWGATPTNFGDSPFHRELARESLDRGWLRLWLLELGGRPIAAWHGFHVGTVCSYYQAGRDPAFERLSVGFVLLAHSIRSAIAEGASEYRFGRGDEPFKSRFTGNDPGLETTVVTRSAIGRLLVAGARTARFARRGLRR